MTFAAGYGPSDVAGGLTPVRLESLDTAITYYGTFNQATSRWSAANVPSGPYAKFALPI